MPHRLYIFKKVFLLKSPLFLGIFGGMTWLSFAYMPSANFIWILAISMAIDLVTGIRRAWKEGKYTTMSGLLQTIDKFTQYAGFIIVLTILMNMTVGEKNLAKYGIIVDASFTFMVLIELFSICENLVAISPRSKIVEMAIKPFIKMVRGRLPGQEKKKQKDVH